MLNNWQIYWNKRILICVCLGFTSGLPLFILLNLVQVWLYSEGVSLKQIGLFSLISFPYTWKVFWAPLMDRYAPRLGPWRFGRRRGWMLITQILVLITVAILGFIPPKEALGTVAILATCIAIFSASLDIALDAYRRELLLDREQGLGTAIHVNAYKASSLVPGSLALILADFFSWPFVFTVSASFMLPGICMTLFVKEPALIKNAPKTLREAIVLPFYELITRKGVSHAILLITFILLYKLGDSMASALATPFFLDLGFSKTEIGIVAKTTGLWASIAGGLIGGVWLIRLGIARGLWIFGFSQMLATLSFAWLSYAGNNATTWDLGIAMALETFAAGLGTAAFTAYIAMTTDARYTATQFALFTSLASIPRTFVNASTGYIVTEIGWFQFFLLCAALAMPGMLLLFKVAPWKSSS